MIYCNEYSNLKLFAQYMSNNIIDVRNAYLVALKRKGRIYLPFHCKIQYAIYFKLIVQNLKLPEYFEATTINCSSETCIATFGLNKYFSALL